MRLNFTFVVNEIRHADDVAAFVCFDPISHGRGYEFTMAGCKSAGNHRVVRAILGVGRTGEANAVFAGDTGVVPAVWQSVDEQWDSACYPTQLLLAKG